MAVACCFCAVAPVALQAAVVRLGRLAMGERREEECTHSFSQDSRHRLLVFAAKTGLWRLGNRETAEEEKTALASTSLRGF